MKKLFKNRITKKDLMREIKELKFFALSPRVQHIEYSNDIIDIGAVAIIDTQRGAPMEYYKRELAKQMLEELMGNIQYDMQDSINSPFQVEMMGRLKVVRKK